jgi:hypothetical protein
MAGLGRYPNPLFEVGRSREGVFPQFQIHQPGRLFLSEERLSVPVGVKYIIRD